MFATDEFPTYEEIIGEYAKEFAKYITPDGGTSFGFWMQTLADLQFLDLELKGLTEEYSIDPVNRTVMFVGEQEKLRLRVAHLERVNGRTTVYAELVDTFGDTNAYAFHNLYPYKGKFYPRVVRTLINGFRLETGSLILDPFNGSGTTTHEASLMGLRSVGIEITPVGVLLARLKNDLLFIDESKFDLTPNDLSEVLHLIESRRWQHCDPVLEMLMLVLYFDTADAFTRTSRYNKDGKLGLFVRKFNYVRECYKKTREIRDRFGLKFEQAEILGGDALELSNMSEMKERFDACITSPPYYFSIDYVGKDKIFYDYMGVNMNEIESKYLGMKAHGLLNAEYYGLPRRVAMYYTDLRRAVRNIFWALKPGGKLAIVVGDSSVDGKKIPTTMVTKRLCEESGFRFERLIFNPLLGARNRAIRGESVIICEKP
jgi:SAM-dependent methyltransferase